MKIVIRYSKKIIFVLIILVVFSSGCASGSKTENDIINKKILEIANRKSQVKTIIIKFKKNTPSETKNRILSKQPGQVVSKISRLNVYEKKVGSIGLRKTTSLLNNEASVQYVEPNRTRKALVTPNDRYYKRQYGLRLINAPSGWNIERGSGSVTIAIVDTGVDRSHPDLKSKIIDGYDFINNDNDPSDDHGHGTHVAGIAAAVSNNKTGVTGVNWGSKIMPVKVLDSYGSGDDISVSNGIIYAVDHGAKVINMSLGGYGFSKTLQDATDYAYSKGVVVLSAAGNEAAADILYPAGNRNVLGIGALDKNGKIANFSNYNKSVDLTAPGVNIFSTYWHRRHSYAYMSGTSMATPFASGAAALLFNKYPSSSQVQVINKLCRRSIDLGRMGRDNYYGQGKLDLKFCLSTRIRRLVAFKSRNRVRRRRRAKIYGQVRPRKPGTRVKIYLRYAGSHHWKRITSLRTDRHGNFVKYVSPRKTAYFRVRSGNTKSLKIVVIK